MEAAFQYVKEQRCSLREASRLHGVPVETLRRRVNGMVDMDCKPGPPTIFTSEEEDLLVKYIVNMGDMGFGLSTDDIMALAFSIAERTHKERVQKWCCRTGEV